MPQFSDLSDQQIAALVTWIHYARQQGRYQELTAASVRRGDATEGKAYFDRACGSCHKADGDLARVGSRYDAAGLRAALLKPKTLERERSFTLERRNDKAFAAAQQRHHALLENYAADDVANLVAYLGNLKSETP